VCFRYRPSGTPQRVHLAGTFNEWRVADPGYELTEEEGTWSITVPLSAGTHCYKYVVDDAWRGDPYAPEQVPDGVGGYNSRLTIPS